MRVVTRSCFMIRAMKRYTNALTGVLATLAFVVTAWGQTIGSTVLGTVESSTGMKDPGAPVTIINTQTNARRDVTTDASGDYLVTDLPPGQYTVTAEIGGATFLQSAVELHTNAKLRVDFKLRAGPNGLLTLAPNNSLLSAETPVLWVDLWRDSLHDLPLLDRKFLELAGLEPGADVNVSSGRNVVSGTPIDTRRDVSGASVNLAGVGSDTNNFLIDGVSDNTEFSRGINVLPDPDAIEEFTLVSTRYAAELGQAGGGIVHLALRSGTNAFHGFAYDSLGSDKLDARQFFDIRKLPLRANLFGAGLGGPASKNKLFFFASYQGVRSSGDAQVTGVTPTPLEKQGIFTRSGYTIYDPNSLHPDPNNPSQLVRDPFPGNAIPKSQLNPVGTALVNAWPNPNYSAFGIQDNYLATESGVTGVDELNFKIDASLTSRDTLTAHYLQQRSSREDSGPWPNDVLGNTALVNGTNAALGYEHIIGPALSNDFHFAYNYARFINSLKDSTDILDGFSIPGVPNNTAAQGFPLTAISGLMPASSSGAVPEYPTPFLSIENNFQFVDSLSQRIGAHSLRYGVEAERLRNDQLPGLQGNLAMSYSGEYTSPGPGQFLPSGVSDALLGLASSLRTLSPFDKTRLRFSRIDAYVQDDWRVNSRLTVSLGLRYDYDGPSHELDDRLTNFSFSSGTILLPQNSRPLVQEYLGTPGGSLPSTFQYVSENNVVPHANALNFAPRFGFARSVFTWAVIQGGFGLFYGVEPANYYSNGGIQSPFANSLLLNGSQTTGLNLASGLPAPGSQAYLSSPGLTAYYTPLNAHTPYVEKYSVNIEFTPGSAAVMDLGYSGQRALAFPMMSYGNVPLPGPGPIASRREFPQIGLVEEDLPINDSFYNALEAVFRLRPLHGLSVQSAFTCANRSSYTSALDGNAITNPYNFRYDWGQSDYQIPLQWVTSAIYSLPKTARKSALARYVVNDWQISGLLTLQDGLPFTATLGEDILNNGLGTNR